MGEIQVLLVSRDPSRLLAATDLAFRDHGYRVEILSSTGEAVESLRKGERDFVLIDLFLSSAERLEFLNHVHVLSPSSMIMILAGEDDVDLLLDDERLSDDYSFGFVSFQEDPTSLCGG